MSLLLEKREEGGSLDCLEQTLSRNATSEAIFSISASNSVGLSCVVDLNNWYERSIVV
jgi:hypothetical protein